MSRHTRIAITRSSLKKNCEAVTRFDVVLWLKGCIVPRPHCFRFQSLTYGKSVSGSEVTTN